jgi:hypothetical protein
VAVLGDYHQLVAVLVVHCPRHHHCHYHYHYHHYHVVNNKNEILANRVLTGLSQRIRAVSITAIICLCIFSMFSFASSQNTSRISDTTEPGISEDEITYRLIVPIITAVGAISGAIAGTYFTGRTTLNLEKKRIEEQRRKENEIQRRVQEIVSVELRWVAAILSETQKEDNPDEKSKSILKSVMSTDRQYPKLPIETKVSCFSPSQLEKIELAYNMITPHAELFKSTYRLYEGGEINFQELKERLDLESIKETCVEAIEALDST